MRIFATILKVSLLLVIVLVLGFFLSREVVAHWGVSSLKRSLNTLKKAQSEGMYVSECQRMGSEAVTGETLVTYQLRFLNSSEYVLEALCSRFSLSPIVFERSTLPSMVTKVPGTSGFIWTDLYRSGVELAVFSDFVDMVQKELLMDASWLVRTKKVIVDDRVIVVTENDSELNDGPVTSCQGYGYQCCQATTQVGMGEQIVGLPDCSDQCFKQCGSRPSILSFTSNPFFDAKTRTLDVTSGSIVEFLYVSDAKSTEVLTATLDFGDGIQSNIDGSQASASHAYTCEQAECQYTAILRLRDQWGVDSAISPLSQVNVIVRGQ